MGKARRVLAVGELVAQKLRGQTSNIIDGSAKDSFPLVATLERVKTHT